MSRISRDELINGKAAVLTENKPLRRRLGRLAWILDSSIPLPGGFSIGLDALIGLVPGVGDSATALMSTYIIAEGVRAGTPKTVIARMVGNVFLETVFGSIPVLGDLFDAVFKANVRNVALLEDHLEKPESTKRASWWFFVFAIAALLIIVIAGIWLSILFLRWLVGLF